MRPAASHIHPVFFFFNDTATTEIYTLSLHDALPISPVEGGKIRPLQAHGVKLISLGLIVERDAPRSEEHTSELQSRLHLVCRLLLEKKKWSSRRRICGRSSARGWCTTTTRPTHPYCH